MRAEFGDRFLTSAGIYKTHLREGVTEVPASIQQSLDTVFAKSDDLYPDLTVFPRDLCELGQSRLERLHLLNSGIAPLHLVEWKFTNSFASIQRGHLRTDAMKLELLSWYFHARGWRRPEAIQVVFRFPHERLKVTSDRIMAWYSAADLVSEIPNVTVLLIDDQGTVTTLHKATW